jgi:hypothetical protein
MTDAMISEVVQRTMATAGVALCLDYCSLETRMCLALHVEGAMEALYFLAVGADLSMTIEDIRRGAASAARLYGHQYAEEMVSA